VEITEAVVVCVLQYWIGCGCKSGLLEMNQLSVFGGRKQWIIDTRSLLRIQVLSKLS
jgi:hypothetical protein